MNGLYRMFRMDIGLLVVLYIATTDKHIVGCGSVRLSNHMNFRSFKFL